MGKFFRSIGQDRVRVSLKVKTETKDGRWGPLKHGCTGAPPPPLPPLEATYRMEYSTLPFLNILSSLLSVVTSWK